MAKNNAREFATMSDDERRRFAQEEGAAPADEQEELEFDDPRDPERMGKHYATPKDEVADPEGRDGAGAQLDDIQHRRGVRRQSRQRRDSGRPE